MGLEQLRRVVHERTERFGGSGLLQAGEREVTKQGVILAPW